MGDSRSRLRDRAWPQLARWIVGHRQVSVTLTLLSVAMGQVALMALRSGPLNSRREYLALEIALAGLGAMALVAGVFPRMASSLERVGLGIGAALGRAAWLAWFLLLTLLPMMALGSWGRFLQPLWVRASALWLIALAAATLISSVWADRSPEIRLAASLLAGGAVYQAATQLPLISGDPLSLGWSEASRYYYASLYLSKRIYGFSAPLSVLHPGRYLLQAVPFLLAGTPLWLHRLWQALLWIGLPLLTAWLLARRLRPSATLEYRLFVLWGLLFLFQGPILYHLLPAALPVLWAMRPERPGRTLLLVLAGSAWAGISRINWFAVPGLLAAALYFLERPPRIESRWRYWAWPLAWIGLGGLVAAFTNAGYILISGNAASEFGSSFTSDLFWYRLLPNATFAPGILLAVGLISLPPALVLREVLKRHGRALDRDRWLPLGGTLGILLAGGVLVSVKIGGGSNLHNLDAYLLLLLVVVGYAGLRRVARAEAGSRTQLSWASYLLLFGIPLLFNLTYGAPASGRDRVASWAVIQDVRERVVGLGADPQVLFLSERQLLTFGYVGPLDLIPGYEKVFLMEMAMSGTQPYLTEFHTALRHQEFDLIVSEPLGVQYQGRSRAFGEENDAWVREVSLPVLCYYEPTWTAEAAPVQLLERRSVPACPEGGGTK